MKSTLTTSPRPTTQPAVFKLTASGTFVERMRQISVAIANRAYELFEARGSEHGHDWEDWFRAESELLTPIPPKSSTQTEGLRFEPKSPVLQAKI
jgi:hypothetical protein